MCNYDINPLNNAEMCLLRTERSADQIVVVIKLRADESMVTCLRVKLVEIDRDVKGKGSGMLTKGDQMYR